MKESVRAGLPRSVEMLLAAASLIVATPVVIVAGAAVAVTSGLPVFFRQSRVGRNGRRFTLVKLRTMRVGRGGPLVTAHDDARVTPVGRFLRRTKLDELPELWNVLKGDMSFVGPRPEVPELVDAQSPQWKAILLARPGLTDPVTLRLWDEERMMAGVDGDRASFYRDTVQPMKLDGYRDYLCKRSWQSDLRVLFVTALALLLPRRHLQAGAFPDLSRRPPRP